MKSKVQMNQNKTLKSELQQNAAVATVLHQGTVPMF